MRVFRIEAINGAGLYNSGEPGGYGSSLAKRLSNYFTYEGDKNQPPPGDDGLTEGWKQPDMIYGFAGFGQLLDWISGCPVEELYAQGGRIVALDIKDAEFGYRQCRFLKNDIINRKNLNLYDLQQEFLNGDVQRFAA